VQTKYLSYIGNKLGVIDIRNGIIQTTSDGGDTMSDIQLVDVTIHIDKETDAETRARVEAALRTVDGVVSVAMPEEKPHLVMVEYDPEKTKATHLHESIREIVGHAELIGL
jgi:hypothetical protein